MKNFLFILAITFFCAKNTYSQKASISGKVMDNSKETLGGVKISLSNSLNTYSDLEGNFSLVNITPGIYIIHFSGLGFQNKTTKEIEIKADENLLLEFIIEEENSEIALGSNFTASKS
ncbi:MAG: carboxypeptidase-like regulatory domain-containing protein [Bacteroidetes bacterium]|nr:carboxypeptidase-like regulatory domain-containing protein [Bacteroidota bacterium]